MVFCRTSKMSHDRGRRASCGLRLLLRWLHLILRSLAGGVTDVGVGSGALLGLFSRPFHPHAKHIFARGVRSDLPHCGQGGPKSDRRWKNVMQRVVISSPVIWRYRARTFSNAGEILAARMMDDTVRPSFCFSSWQAFLHNGSNSACSASVNPGTSTPHR